MDTAQYTRTFYLTLKRLAEADPIIREALAHLELQVDLELKDVTPGPLSLPDIEPETPLFRSGPLRGSSAATDIPVQKSVKF